MLEVDYYMSFTFTFLPELLTQSHVYLVPGSDV
jgi:hypothetical protein